MKIKALILIVFFIFFTGCNSNSTEMIVDENKEANDNSIVEENVELEFETYLNSEYGFEFQYPSNWEIRQQPEEKGDPLVIANSGYPDDRKDYFIIWPDVLVGTYLSSELDSASEMLIDEVKAIKELHLYYHSIDGFNKDNGYYRIYIYKNDKTIEFSMEYPSNDDELYDRIINSIKFI